FDGDPRAATTVSAALDGAYAVGGIYEDFTLFYGAAVHIAKQFDDAELFERLRRIVDDDGSTPPNGLAGHRALLEALEAPRAEERDVVAEASFVAAMTHYRNWGSPVHLTRCRAEYAVWLCRRGRVDEAQPLLHEARTTYASLGAVGWL